MFALAGCRRGHARLGRGGYTPPRWSQAQLNEEGPNLGLAPPNLVHVGARETDGMFDDKNARPGATVDLVWSAAVSSLDP